MTWNSYPAFFSWDSWQEFQEAFGMVKDPESWFSKERRKGGEKEGGGRERKERERSEKKRKRKEEKKNLRLRDKYLHR